MRLHASCVAYDNRAVLIKGRSGSGKSSLALQLMAYGARLVADDQVLIVEKDGWPMIQAPAPISGMIEARYFGLLVADPIAEARLAVVVDLDHIETERLPPERQLQVYSQPIPLFHKAETEAFPAAILQYLKGGKVPL